MEIQTRVAPPELSLRDDLENIYALLFRFLGFGFRLAMSNVGWHVTQKFVMLVPDPIAFAPQQKQLSDFVETKKYWTLLKSCGSQSSEWEERKKSRAKRGSLCTRDGSRKTVTLILFYLLFFFITLCEQAIIAAAGRRLRWRRESNAAGSDVLSNLMCCPFTSLTRSLVLRSFPNSEGLVCISTEHLLRYAWTCVCFQ